MQSINNSTTNRRGTTPPLETSNLTFAPRTKHSLLLVVATLGLTLMFNPVAAHVQGLRPFTFDLVPASDAIANCTSMPNPAATVTLFPREDSRGGGYAGFACRGPATQYDICGLRDRTAGATLRCGSVYRGLHHECGGQRACPRG